MVEAVALTASIVRAMATLLQEKGRFAESAFPRIEAKIPKYKFLEKSRLLSAPGLKGVAFRAKCL
jgi:hypothetical protein